MIPTFFLHEAHFIVSAYNTFRLFVFRRIAGALLGEARRRTLGLQHGLAGQMAIGLLAVDATVLAQVLEGRRKRTEALPSSVHRSVLPGGKKSFRFHHNENDPIPDVG